jgi:hypothetical protein
MYKKEMKKLLDRRLYVKNKIWYSEQRIKEWHMQLSDVESTIKELQSRIDNDTVLSVGFETQGLNKMHMQTTYTGDDDE